MTPRWVRVLRAASLVVAPAIGWGAALHAPHPGALTSAVAYLLGPVWLAITLGLIWRVVDARRRRRQGLGALSSLDVVDVLTASGSGTLWLSSFAIAAAAQGGWASLAVVGVMGLAVVELMVVWTLLVAGGDDPLGTSAAMGAAPPNPRSGLISRRFVPATAVEADPVVEELTLSGARIPAGFRLFATGRVGPRWPTSRYAVDASASGAEVVITTELGPALRGDHAAPPLECWLGDVLGICHTVRRPAARASLLVTPRPRVVEGVRPLLSRGGHDQETRTSQRLPTEGAMRLREYAPGDDARRIHWVRSLAARQVVVRLPDELPPDRPGVRLVLDTFLAPPRELSCNAQHDLLDEAGRLVFSCLTRSVYAR